jgi:hypothetical protein
LDARLLAQTRQTGPALSTTSHPPLPGHPSLFWLVPESSLTRSSSGPQTVSAAVDRFARGAALIANGDYAAGLRL